MFDPQRFKHTSAGPYSVTPDLWLYNSTDLLTQIQVDNYFVDAGMKNGDLLYMRAKDGAGLFTVVVNDAVLLKKL